MASRLNSDSSNGLQLISDSSGEIQIQSSGTTICTINSSGLSMQSGVLAPTGPAASVRLSANPTVATGTWTKMQFNTEVFDTNNCFDTSTYTFTPNVAGYYLFTASVFSSTGTSVRPVTAVRKNEVESLSGCMVGTGVDGGQNSFITGLLYANGTTDYFNVYYRQNSGSNVTVNGYTSITYFDAHLVRAV